MQLSLELSKLSNLEGSFLSGFMQELEKLPPPPPQLQPQLAAVAAGQQPPPALGTAAPGAAQQPLAGGRSLRPRRGSSGAGAAAAAAAAAAGPPGRHELSRQSSDFSKLLQQIFPDVKGDAGALGRGLSALDPDSTSWLRRLDGALSALPAMNSLPPWSPDLDLPALEEEGLRRESPGVATRSASKRAAAAAAGGGAAGALGKVGGAWGCSCE